MLFIWLGILALFFGPLLVSTLGRYQVATRILDTFVVVAIGGLVFAHILPESLNEAGWPALGAVLLGAVAPTLLHSPLNALYAPCHNRATKGLLVLAASAISLHAFFDGVALAPCALHPLQPGHLPGEHGHVALAVILHRILEGTGLWYLLRPALGRPWALCAMLALAAATGLGSAGASWLVASGGEFTIALIQASVAGSLLHVLAHHASGSQTPQRQWPWESATGLCLAIAFLSVLTTLQHGDMHADAHAAHNHLHFWPAIVGLSANMAPWLVVSLALVALMHALVPSELPRLKFRRARSVWGTLLQTLFGAVHGLATDTALARVAGLWEHIRAEPEQPGAEIKPATTAFLLAAPACGMTAGIISLISLGLTVTLCRIGVLVLWATLAAVALGAPKQPLCGNYRHSACTETTLVTSTRLGDGVHFALGQNIDALGPWLLLGLMLATLMQQTLGAADLIGWETAHVDVPLLGVLAAPIYLNPLASTLIGLVLWHKGLSVGALVSYTLCSSTISLVSFRQLTEAFGAHKAWASMFGLYGLSVAAGYGINFCTVHMPQSPLSFVPPVVTLVSGGIVCALVARSCLRQGVRAFLAPITAWGMHLGGHHHH